MSYRDDPEDLPDADDVEHESADDDFNPESASAEDSAGSSTEEEHHATTSRKSKRKAVEPAELDSGDEFTIERARKRRAKGRKGGTAENDDDMVLSADEGGLIKTRAQRMVEKKERRPLAKADGVTIDVDALWAQMKSQPLHPLLPEVPTTRDDGAAGHENTVMDMDTDEGNTVAVKKVYTFAGQRTTEEKDVPRSALDHYLADGWVAVDKGNQNAVEAKPKDGEQGPKAEEMTDSQPKVRRPLRRPSRFDPNPTGYVRTLPPELQLAWPRKTSTTTAADQENVPAPELSRVRQPEKAQKLNVVDKSRLDWTGFVDKEGIADELTTHGKTKEAYLGRMEFLASVEARREDERLKAKPSAT
ncbi:SWR1-complex protein 5 [Polyplosphaeria fusca]|uniref:SWR1-complex protein 5 n=1 Tax=Polyplosphaeria fusca TaxID=682080 RepID=A0A9P4RCJ6_9PLEO|nr:SWR1-complex protein 5 [Polyplosphaeria fusca]